MAKEAEAAVLDEIEDEVEQPEAAVETPEVEAPVAETPEAPAAEPAKPSLSGLRDYYATKHQLDLGDIADDQLAETLLQNARAAQQYQQQVRQYEQQIQQLQYQYQQAQQPAPKAEEKPKSLWERRPKAHNWAEVLERDAEGNIKTKPGVPPSVLNDYYEDKRWREEALNQWLENPHEVVKPLVQEEAKALVAAEMAAFQQKQQGQAIISRHASWLFDQNARSHDGKPALTPLGQQYMQICQRLEASGVKDVNEQDWYASQQIAALMQLQQPQANQAKPTETPAEVKKKELLAKNGRHANTTNGYGRAAVDKTQEGMTVRDSLRHAFKDLDDTAFGFTEEN